MAWSRRKMHRLQPKIQARPMRLCIDLYICIHVQDQPKKQASDEARPRHLCIYTCTWTYRPRVVLKTCVSNSHDKQLCDYNDYDNFRVLDDGFQVLGGGLDQVLDNDFWVLDYGFQVLGEMIRVPNKLVGGLVYFINVGYFNSLTTSLGDKSS
jgi:hypothetical protein